MISKNSMLTGFFVALIFPAIAAAVEYLLKNNYYLINKPAVPYFVAVALNLILIRFALKRNLDQSARGIMLCTFIITLLVLTLKIHLHR